MSKHEVTAKFSAWIANLIAVGIIAIVSSHIWLLIQVSALQTRIMSLDIYTKENAATASAMQSLTDTKQDGAIGANKTSIEDMRSRINALQNDVNVIRNKVN